MNEMTDSAALKRFAFAKGPIPKLPGEEEDCTYLQLNGYITPRYLPGASIPHWELTLAGRNYADIKYPDSANIGLPQDTVKQLHREHLQKELAALKQQIGGNHYKGMKIQPVEFIHANKIPFIEGCIIKYACRHREKNGKQDLLKIKHFVDLLISLEYPDA